MKYQSFLFVIYSFALTFSVVKSRRIVVGVIVRPEEARLFEQIKNSVWFQDEFLFRNVDVLKETVEDGDAVELNRAVCRLMNFGIVALFSTTTPFSYKVLLPFSNEFHLPLISPSFPATGLDYTATYGVDIKPSTTRVILDIFRAREWKDIVYIYDTDHGPERLHEIFLLGYRVMESQLAGILDVSQPEDANLYLRKLNSVKRNRNFQVILDTRVELARDIIVRHVHDAHIRKSNFRFIITEPVLDDFWTSQKVVFGAISVTGFRIHTLESRKTNHYLSALKQSIQEHQEQLGIVNIPVSAYFMHDALLILAQAMKKICGTECLTTSYGKPLTPNPVWDTQSHNCMENVPIPLSHGAILSQYLKELQLDSGLTGEIQFDPRGRRKMFSIDVIETTPSGHQIIGSWSDSNGLRIRTETNFPTPSARIDKRKKYKITSILNAPYLMINNGVNDSAVGNNRFHGFLKDLIDILARDMNFDYDLQVVEDGKYGIFDETSGRWTGMIGEVILGKADIAAADLTVSSRRLRVIDFTEHFHMVSLSLLMKNPIYANSAMSSLFFFTSFSGTVWICIFVSAVIISILLFVISKFTGSPDSIESASGLWGKKFTVGSSLWFILGNMLFQGTGVYPRSISSRILSVTWWCFSLLMLALFIANVLSQLYVARIDDQKNPRLNQLKSLTMESVVAESVARGWPTIGLIKGSSTEKFVKASTLPIYKAYSDFLRLHPEVMVSTAMEGFRKVRQSNGHYGFLTESSKNEYVNNQEPCNTVMLQDSVTYAVYALAVPKGSPLRFELNLALTKIRERGELGHLRSKWWIEGSPCLKDDIIRRSQFAVNLHSTSGIFYIFLLALCVAAVITGVQYFWRKHKKEERRRKLSFEDMTLGQSLPLPSPELLNDPPLEEDSGVIDGWAERQLVPTSFGDRSSS